MPVPSEPALRLLSSVETEPPSELRALGNNCEDESPSTSACAAGCTPAQCARRLEPFDVRLAATHTWEALAAAIWASDPDQRDLIQEAARRLGRRRPVPASADA
jgi:hypothetical protein